jgi:hypothetical protein
MNKKMEVLRVDDNGKICVKCSSCKKYRMKEAPRGNRFVLVSCSCGTKTPFKLEWRRSLRKKYDRLATIGNKTVKIRDLSSGGVAIESLFDIPIGIETKISFVFDDISKGEKIESSLTIKVVSRKEKKYGAMFLDLADYSKLRWAIHFWLQER